MGENVKRFVLAACALIAAGISAFADVVPTDAPALVLKGRTLADVQANEISGTAIGTHMRPRNMIGLNKVMLPAAGGQPARLRVEMQMMDSYHLKCIVLELFDGAELPAAVTASVQQQAGAVGGVYGRAVAASYVLTKDHGLGWRFVNADGSLNGTAHPLVTNPKGAGYGIADLTLVPRDIDVGDDAVLAGHPTHDLRNWIAKARACADGDERLADYYETDARRIITVWAPGLGDYAARVWSGLVANYYLPRLRLARAGKAKEIRAWQNKWVEERLPIAPPAPGWTCEKLVDELVAAWEDFSKI